MSNFLFKKNNEVHLILRMYLGNKPKALFNTVDVKREIIFEKHNFCHYFS